MSTFLSGRLARDKVTYPESHDGVTVERFYDYDWRGLPIRKAEVFGGGGADPRTFTTVYGNYDLAGNARTVVYPSGQTVTRDYTQGGGLAAVGDGVTTLYDNLAWAAHGAPFKLSLHDAAGVGGTVNWVQTFNNRLWPAQIKAGHGIDKDTGIDTAAVLLGLNYTGYEANGNITAVTRYGRQQQGSALSTLPFTYTYDNLNRLWKTDFQLGAVTNRYTFSMDEFGNVTGQDRTAGSDPAPGDRSMPVDSATNRLTGAGVDYDDLGNLRKTADFTYKLYYQDQGHVLDMKNATGTTLLYRYFYDADGKRRIKVKADGSGLVTLADDCSFFFYEGEELICQQDLGDQVHSDQAFYEPKFLLIDHLGTTRAEFKFNGTTPTIIQHYDPMPYGELIDQSRAVTENILFTGKQRDEETGCAYYGGRYNIDKICRWLSVDPQFVSKQRMFDPQQWNLCTYVRNNPVKLVDPDGMELNLYLINHAGYTNAQATAIGAQVGRVLHNAGVKNVRVIVTKDMKVTEREGRHTVVGELMRGQEGALGINVGSQGRHSTFSHEFAVNVKEANPVPNLGGRSAEQNEAIAVGNVVAHEVIHETNSGLNYYRAFTEGRHDNAGLFVDELGAEAYKSNPLIMENRAEELQDQFNRTDEIDELAQGWMVIVEEEDLPEVQAESTPEE